MVLTQSGHKEKVRNIAIGSCSEKTTSYKKKIDYDIAIVVGSDQVGYSCSKFLTFSSFSQP